MSPDDDMRAVREWLDEADRERTEEELRRMRILGSLEDTQALNRYERGRS